ncbi:MAG: sigma-54-dependent Fis family transcriptional regulator [Deltaproteobacteria bacterium]|nr:sigma-54-dependent Fis family transcriptional regulator [Deltaproteobacteria bacterium]
MEKNQILVVDDEGSMRLALSEALRRGGYAVDTAADGFDALQKFRTDRFHMVITDVKMPKMNGLDVLREIKRISPRTPVIMVTAYGTIQNAVDAMKEGASDYILKPFSYEDLESAVKRVMTTQGRGAEQGRGTLGSVRSKSRTIVTQNREMQKLLELARNIAPSNATVLIQGESGTGKELLARFIFENSPRRDKPFVAINCAAVPENLLESELFGHEKGSFTGAVSQRIGKFEMAHHGTILLDEIGEMSLQLQAKLLRVLQEFELDRIGGKGPISIDVRVIATTNEDLHRAVAEGRFREDLFYRLNVIPLTLPPLRERKEDIPLLVDHFLKKIAERGGPRREVVISQEGRALLLKYDWKGNVRELENFVERAALVCEDGVIYPRHFFLDGTVKPRTESRGVPVGSTLKEMERQLILKTLEEVEGNRTRAAKVLGISIRTLRNKLNEYRAEAGEKGEKFA